MPQNAYGGAERYADIKTIPDGLLIIYGQRTGDEIARHEISYENGRLIKNNDLQKDS